MNEIILEWQEAGNVKKQVIRDQQPSKNPGTVRLGRDPLRCDIVLTHPTVSGLHVEIFYHPQQQQFYLRNLRDSNPPWVNGNQLANAEIALSQGTTFHLGETEIKIIAMNIEQVSSVPPTILISSPRPGNSQTYGLQCPNAKCGRISPYQQLDLGCPWCGTSLAAAESVLMNPKII